MIGVRSGTGLPLLAVAAALAAGSTPAFGQAVEPRLDVSVDTTRMTVGDRIVLTVTVEHDAGATVRWPDSLDLAPFEVVDARAAPAVEGRDRTSAAAFALTAFELGEVEIPGFDVTVVGPDGAETVLPTDPFVIEVVSVGLDEGDDIRDVKGPLSIPWNLLLLWPWLLALLAAAGAGYAWARHAKARGAPAAPDRAKAPPRPPHEVAYEALDWLEASPMLEQGRIKEYYIEVSDVVRRYVEGRYGIPALEMTSHELLWRLGRQGVGGETLDGFTAFLDVCDLVKFAKHRPDPSACGEVVPLARWLVDATRERPRPEPDPDAGESEAAEGHRPGADVSEDAHEMEAV